MPLRTLAHTQGHGLAGRRRPRPLGEMSDSFMNTPRRLKNAHIRKKLLTMDITDYAVIDAMTLPELRVALKQRRIDTEGNKSTLVRRMKELASEQPAPWGDKSQRLGLLPSVTVGRRGSRTHFADSSTSHPRGPTTIGIVEPTTEYGGQPVAGNRLLYF